MENKELNDEEALALRLSGVQPTIDIAGQLFYVDMHWGFLRPKDDFTTQGIRIKDIEDWQYESGETYRFAYDPKNRCLKYYDLDQITSYPEDFVIVEIPETQRLDPVGYARKYNWDLDETVKETPAIAHHTARIVPWKETGFDELIAENKKRLDTKAAPAQKVETQVNKRKRGKKL